MERSLASWRTPLVLMELFLCADTGGNTVRIELFKGLKTKADVTNFASTLHQMLAQLVEMNGVGVKASVDATLVKSYHPTLVPHIVRTVSATLEHYPQLNDIFHSIDCVFSSAFLVKCAELVRAIIVKTSGQKNNLVSKVSFKYQAATKK